MNEKSEKMDFEKALKQLEKLVKELEDENISLESAMEKFETGIKLSSFCLNKLNEAEKKIEELSHSENGKLISKELQIEE
ncbi:MAG: exodeoxyribonuclease VII small subunit [Actinomycetota bacterium]|nr:exodeoxyribonuclease VII small subunit [Actinomycetota bacterium]